MPGDFCSPMLEESKDKLGRMGMEKSDCNKQLCPNLGRRLDEKER